jgi:hypothetical protein
MPNYVLAFHGGAMARTEEARQAAMAAWERWYQDLGPAIVDVGNPVGRARTIASDGSVTDGGGPNPVTGYTIVTADDLDAAVEMTSGCPVLASGGSVEVCETSPAM